MEIILRMKSLLFTTLFAFLFLSSCSLERKITGTWNITEYSENGVDGSSSSAVNAGKIEFNKNGTGANDLEYKIFGNGQKDKRSFTYYVGDDYITIKPAQNGDSIATKSWIIIESKRSKQLWKSTDGEGNVQTIVLKKAD
ncbi:hypothetical protein C9994_00655 [Marivirga lumbricoides]|uniref:Lipocalin-like domain-containing protein n=1 Tax=Marivirga lumbricoides TaxID=1046115 RepID=A0A2T4DVK5_9BACT|nr:hypothetical protein C9994_00655 [Marivirga lumbricoides]